MGRFTGAGSKSFRVFCAPVKKSTIAYYNRSNSECIQRQKRVIWDFVIEVYNKPQF